MATSRNTRKKTKSPMENKGRKTGQEPAWLGLSDAVPLIEALEARLVFDAAFEATIDKKASAIELPACVDFPAPVLERTVVLEDKIVTAPETSPERPVIEIQNLAADRQSIIFVDYRVEDIDVLSRSFPMDAEVHILSADRDGVEQIAAVLEGRTGIDALHIVSHGRSGTLDLGSTKLTEASILGRHADEMAVIRSALSEQADILLYGCEFAAGARGETALQALATATGADVAASEDVTGAADLGGNWVLEHTAGTIEAASLQPKDYHHTLWSTTNTAAGWFGDTPLNTKCQWCRSRNCLCRTDDRRCGHCDDKCHIAGHDNRFPDCGCDRRDHCPGHYRQ
jgi:hypothetical protein